MNRQLQLNESQSFFKELHHHLPDTHQVRILCESIIMVLEGKNTAFIDRNLRFWYSSALSPDAVSDLEKMDLDDFKKELFGSAGRLTEKIIGSLSRVKHTVKGDDDFFLYLNALPREFSDPVSDACVSDRFNLWLYATHPDIFRQIWDNVDNESLVPEVKKEWTDCIRSAMIAEVYSYQGSWIGTLVRDGDKLRMVYISELPAGVVPDRLDPALTWIPGFVPSSAEDQGPSVDTALIDTQSTQRMHAVRSDLVREGDLPDNVHTLDTQEKSMVKKDRGQIESLMDRMLDVLDDDDDSVFDSETPSKTVFEPELEPVPNVESTSAELPPDETEPVMQGDVPVGDQETVIVDAVTADPGDVEPDIVLEEPVTEEMEPAAEEAEP
ncbi:MAG TPA: hypothetical protein PLV45_15530, partial [bacterium]|nr:hypothetical protein [bacterium]